MADEIAGQQRLAAEKALGHEQEAPKASVPAELRATTNPEPSYKAVHAERKSDMDKSLDWNAQQKKVAESQ